MKTSSSLFLLSETEQKYQRLLLQKKDKENERFRYPFLEICLKRSFSYHFFSCS